MKPDNPHLDLERFDLSDAPELKRALDAVKEQLPAPTELATLAASLAQIGISVAPPRAAAPTAPSAARLKLLLGAGVVAPVAIALLLWRSPSTHSTEPMPPMVPTAPRPALSSSEEALRPSALAPSEPHQPRANPVASGVAPPSTAPASSSAGSAEGADSAARVRPAPAPLKSSALAVPVQPTATENSRLPVASARATGNNIAPGVVARPTEVALLRDARLALNHDPSEALALAEQHRALFARGAMVQERELIAISALARLGRHTAVLARAAQFERDFPNSPYRKQVSALAQ